MIKVGENKYIVYNCNSLIVLFKIHIKDEERLNSAYFETYANNKNHSNEYIKKNIEEPLSIKDKLKAAYKRSVFNRTIRNEIVLAGEILKPVYLGQEILKTREDEITSMVMNCLSEGEFISGFDMTNGIHVNATKDELEKIVKGFEVLEREHKKRINPKLR